MHHTHYLRLRNEIQEHVAFTEPVALSIVQLSQEGWNNSRPPPIHILSIPLPRTILILSICTRLSRRRLREPTTWLRDREMAVLATSAPNQSRGKLCL